MPETAQSLFWLNTAAIPIFFCAAVIPLTGFYIHRQNSRSAVNFQFFLICAAIFFWMLGQGGVLCSVKPETALAIYRIVVFFGVSFIVPVIYHFSVLWLGLGKEKTKIAVCGYAGAAIFYLSGIFMPAFFPGVRHYEWGFYPVYGAPSYPFLAFFFFYFFLSFMNFARALRVEKNRQRHAQIQLIMLAFVISMFGSTDYIPKLFNFSLFPQGYLCVFSWIMIVAYAIIKYRAMDIETVIHKTLMWLASVSVALAPFMIIIFWTHDFIRKLAPITASLFFCGFVAVFYFYFQGVKPVLDNLFQRRRSDLRDQFEKFSEELVYLTDLRNLLQRFVRLLRRTLYIRELSVFILDETAQSFVPVISKRIRNLKPVPADHSVLAMAEKDAPIARLEDMSSNPENLTAAADIQSFFDSMRAGVLVLFLSGEKLIGFAALGKRMNLQRYNHDDLKFLAQLAPPVGIALSNSRQFEKVQQMSEELQKWNRELEDRVEKRTQELREIQVQLVQAEKMATLGVLAGGVAHEINNPLTAVLTNAQILAMTANEEDKESIQMIEEGAQRCKAIVQKLLNYSRTSSSETAAQKVDLNLAVTNTLNMLKYQLNQENVEIETSLGTVPPVSVNLNELEQVFTNLIINARDAVMKTPSKKGKIQIRTFSEGGRVYAEVRDNGCGIPQEIVSKIFDPFFTTKDVGEGTGLGLSVIQGIVKNYKGRIDVSSQVSIGSVFKVSFPITN